MKYINDIFQEINNNKIFIGISIIFLNIASRYVQINLTSSQEFMLKKIAKELLVFTIVFIGTRDFFISIIITTIFYFLANYFFNENSNLCIMSNEYKNLYKSIDTNKDNIISKEEIQKASIILEKAKRQEELYNQYNMINALTTNTMANYEFN